MKTSKWVLFLLFLPSILALLLVFVIPLLQLLVLSFTNASLSKNIAFIGLENYRKFFQGAEVWSILGRTLVWTVLGVSFKLLLGLGGALLLNADVGHKGFFRAAVLPPWVMPLTISAIVWTWLLNGQFGMISQLLQAVHAIAQPFEFLGARTPALLSVLFVDVWAGVPLIAIFLIAALEAIPPSSLEAAFLEGASRTQRFTRVILPQILPVAASLATITAIFTFNSFDVIWIMTQGGPSGGTTTLPILAYQTSIRRFDLGLGAAQSIVMTLVLALLGLAYLCFQRRRRYA